MNVIAAQPVMKFAYPDAAATMLKKKLFAFTSESEAMASVILTAAVSGDWESNP